nr:transposase [Pseudohalioglobus lutimaris]
MDENFFTRRKGFTTTFVDVKNHNLFEVKLGRSESSLRHYLKGLRGRGNMQVMVMDLSETHRSVARHTSPMPR